MRLIRFSLNLHQQSGYVYVNPEAVAFVRGQTIGMTTGEKFDLQMVMEDDIIGALAGTIEPDQRGGWKAVVSQGTES